MNEDTALLVMDMQVAILGNIPDATKFINNVARAILAARKKSIPVIYVRVGFRKNLPEISPDNKSFWSGRERFGGMEPEQWMAIHSGVTPHENDIIVTKRRIRCLHRCG